MADIVLINPRFEPSYWGLEYAMPFMGKRAVFPVAALPLLAALTPPEAGHRYTIIDENVEKLDFARCAGADIVGLTGMSVQRTRMREILTELKRRNVYKVAAAYTVVAWLLIQAASIILPTFEAPAWTMKVLIAILAIGFPIAVVLAWAFEITPEGIVRAETDGAWILW